MTEPNEATTPEARADQGGQVNQLVMRLRSRFGITHDMATDEDVLEATEGTLLRALEELDMATDDLGVAVKDAVNSGVRSARRKMHSAQAKFLHMLRGA